MTAPVPAPMATPSNVPAWAAMGAAANIRINIPVLSIERMTISSVELLKRIHSGSGQTD